MTDGYGTSPGLSLATFDSEAVWPKRRSDRCSRNPRRPRSCSRKLGKLLQVTRIVGDRWTITASVFQMTLWVIKEHRLTTVEAFGGQPKHVEPAGLDM